MELTEKQKDAVRVATTENRSIITGGAGTGKTTVIKSIIERLTNNGEVNIVLCCPTGKGAARMKEATGYPARTFHSTFGLFPVDGSDEFGAVLSNCPALTATTILVDEASMLDDATFAAGLRKISPRVRIILVGDPNQLPPVGAGYPFRDLVASGSVPHVHLDMCHRQDGRLLANCYSILDGNSRDLIYDAGKGNRKNEEWVFTACSDETIPKSLTAIFSKGVCEESFGIPAEELLVLTPLNKGENGRIQLNREIQRAYHSSRGRAVPTYKTEIERDQFVVGDRVIWTKNDRITQLVNGDVGTVTSVGKDTCVVAFDGVGDRTVEQGINLQLAWVLTCHKAQGSQYAKVLVIQAAKHCNEYLNGIVNRSWCYTAGTRSKKATIWLGSPEAFHKHVSTPSVDRRKTYLSSL